MITNRSVLQYSTRRVFALLRAATCMAIAVSFLVLPAGVSANASWQTQRATLPLAQSPGLGGMQQEPIVEVEVEVRDEADVELLQSLGYTCQVGVCKLELHDGEELALIQLGLSMRVVARAIKVSGGGESPSGVEAPEGEHYAYGSDWTRYDIRDCMWPCLKGGFPTASFITITSAPDYATVSKISYSARFVHQHVGDLFVVLIGSGDEGYAIWDRWGHNDDEGMDDDPEFDADIELRNRETTGYNGMPVNGEWWIWVQDMAWWNTGYVDYWYLYVYYWICEPADLPTMPSNPFPISGATGIDRDHDLDWGDSSRVNFYDVYFGTTNSPPRIDVTTESRLDLSPLSPSTHYYWKIRARNGCGSSQGPVWDFTTACWATVAPTVISPADGASNVPVSAHLDWEDVPGASYYKVYFGTANPPDLKMFIETPISHFEPSWLQFNKHYYWRVEAVNDCSSTIGPIWDFTTKSGIFLPIVIK